MNFDEFLHGRHPFLAGMCEPHLQMLADNARQVHFPAGTNIFREGDPAKHFYLIERGKIELQTHSAGHPVAIHIIDSGEVLGWSWLFPPFCWHFDAWAVKDTDAISFLATRLRDDCEVDKTFGYAVMKRIAELLIHRLKAARLKLVQLEKIEHHTALPVGE